MGFRQYPSANGDSDDDDLAEDVGPDALDIDDVDDANVRGTFTGQGRAAQVADLPDPGFELIRQAYPNRPRPFSRPWI